MNDFQKTLAFTLRWEGGLSDDPDDPGKVTNFGISLAAHPKLGAEGIRKLTRDQAGEIYRKEYWEGSGADELPWPLCLAVFDTAVNLGTVAARTYLAAGRAFGFVDPIHLAVWVLAQRKAHYQVRIKESPRAKKWKDGWDNRLGDLAEEVLISSKRRSE